MSMVKAILIVTLTAAGQPPATYRAEFDRMVDCGIARNHALEVYTKAYGYGVIQKGLNFILPTAGAPTQVQIQADCIAPEKDQLQSK
jgi:hypothetical protein